MWVLISLVVVVLLVIGLLFIPIQLRINTNTNTYSVQLGQLAKAYLESDAVEIIKVRMRILGYQFFVYPLKKKKSGKKKIKPKKQNNPKTTHLKLKKGGQWAIRILRSIEITEFHLELDTGNFVRNAQLYPVFGFINHYYLPCRINFQGHNSLVVGLRSRPWNILKSFINF